MNIGDIKPLAKFEADLANGKHFICEVEYISFGLSGGDFVNRNGEKERFSKVVKESLIEAMATWNLYDMENEPIPCTIENKKRRLPFILGQDLKGPEPIENEPVKYAGCVGIALWNFAHDSENFSKN